MISSFIGLTNTELIYLIVTFAISVLVYLSVFKLSFKENICFLIKKLFQIKNSQPILYSYRHISLMVASYFLIVCSFLALNCFYLIVAIYIYCGVPINMELVLYSELSIKIVAILSASLISDAILLYHIHNSNNFIELFKNNHCLLESLLSIVLCAIYIAATKHSKPIGAINGSISSLCIIVILCFILLCAFLHKLQTKKKESLRKLLFGNTKIRELVTISKQENIELLYNILLSDGLTLLIIFYIDSLESITIMEAISYVLLHTLFIGITKGYKIAINTTIKTKEDK